MTERRAGHSKIDRALSFEHSGAVLKPNETLGRMRGTSGAGMTGMGNLGSSGVPVL